MILWDVNLWVYAFRKDSPHNSVSRETIQANLKEAPEILFSPHIASSFLRLVTNPKIFTHPSTTDEAWNFIDYLKDHPRTRYHDVDDMVFGIFKHICLVNGTAGNEAPDALLAALAIRHDARFITFDAGFKVYKGLSLHLLETP